MKRSLLAAATLVLLVVAAIPAARADNADGPASRPSEITIGVRAHLGRERALARWQPTIDYLNAMFPGTAFSLKTYGSPGAIEAAAAAGDFDYVITDPGSFVVMNVRSGVEERLSLINAWDGRAVTRFGSAIFTRRGITEIKSLKDLRGRSLIAVAPNAFGGWFVALREFLRAGLDPADVLGELSFAGGNQQDVVRAVLAGRADAGVVRTGTLERMARRGLISMNSVRVIAPRSVPGFPFAVSTDLYPEWVFAESPGAPDTFRHDILAALTRIGPDDPAAVAGSYIGWQNADNYWPVHELLRKLNEPPYEHWGKASFEQVLRDNRVWIALAVAALLAMFGLLLYALRQHAEVARRNAETALRTGSELDTHRDILDRHAIVSMSNLDGVITHVNDRFVEVSGYTREEIVGKTHTILRSDVTATATYEQMWQTIRCGGIWNGELAIRRKDGSPCWVQTTVAPRLDVKGEIVGFISIRTDVTALKAAQAEMNLRQYLECTPGEVLKFRDRTCEITFANGAAQRMTGLSAEELAGRTLFDFLSEADADWLRQRLNALVKEGGTTIDFEGEFVLPDGDPVATSFHIEYLSAHGMEPRFVATLKDVSDEIETRNQVAELSTTLDTIGDQIFMFWPDSKRFFYANRAAKLSLGLTDEEIRQMTPADLAGGLSPEECDSVLGPIIRGETTQQVFRREVAGPDGAARVMEYDVRHVHPRGRKPRFIAILRDRTEQALAEMELLRFRATLDLIDDEIYMFWPDSYAFTYMSRNSLDRVGWGEEGWRGRHTWDYITDRQQKWLEEKCQALIGGPAKSMIFETQDRNGTPLEIYLRLIEPANDRPRFLSIYRDITEKKQAETAKSQFVSTISHELRTPLTSIKGSLGLLKAGVDKVDPARLTKMLDIAYQNADRLHVLINEILDWEKIEAGEMTYCFEDVDICAAVREAVELNQGYAKQHDVTFRLSAPRRPVTCKGDLGRLQQVMSNLLSNAAKFSGAGKVIEICVEPGQTDVEVSVRDYGEGIPEEARPMIFNRFTQADSSDVRRKGGTGLGLSISKAIVAEHEGTIGFDDAEGGGTRFHFRLPLKEEAARGSEPPAGAETGEGPRVLIGEADPALAMEFWFALERVGMSCSVARSGEQLADQFDSGGADCVVLNQGLAPEAGKRIVKAMTAEGGPDIRVVVYSDEDSPEHDLVRQVTGNVVRQLGGQRTRAIATAAQPCAAGSAETTSTGASAPATQNAQGRLEEINRG